MLNFNNFRDQVDLLPFSLYVKSLDGTYSDCTPFMVQMLHLLYREEVVGKQDSELPWKPEDKIKIKDHYNLTMISNKNFCSTIEEYTDSNGKIHHYLTTKVPLCDKTDKIVGLIGISKDIGDWPQERVQKFEMQFLCMLQALVKDYIFKDIEKHNYWA